METPFNEECLKERKWYFVLVERSFITSLLSLGGAFSSPLFSPSSLGWPASSSLESSTRSFAKR